MPNGIHALRTSRALLVALAAVGDAQDRDAVDRRV